MKEDKKKEIINEIIDEFNFKKCVDYMSKSNWTYGLDGEKVTINDLKRVARKLLEDLLDDDELIFSSTGGFSAVRYGNNIELLFSISDYCYETEEKEINSDRTSENNNEKEEPTENKFNIYKTLYDGLSVYTKALEKELELYRQGVL